MYWKYHLVVCHLLLMVLNISKGIVFNARKIILGYAQNAHWENLSSKTNLLTTFICHNHNIWIISSAPSYDVSIVYTILIVWLLLQHCHVTDLHLMMESSHAMVDYLILRYVVKSWIIFIVLKNLNLTTKLIKLTVERVGILNLEKFPFVKFLHTPR
jgi:hypothetical protein